MRSWIRLWLSACFVASHAAPAQTVIEDNQRVATDTPEAWAMRYFAGTTLMTSFGETPKLAPWHWDIAFDLGSIPHLSDAQQRVGLGGFKSEDLNKSPVFGRLRLAVGLPGDWAAGEWRWYAGAGIARLRLSVQVDALVATSRDRSRLTSGGSLPWFTIGLRHDLGPQWSLAAELLYVPLDVRRPPDLARANESLTSVRVQLRYSSN